MILTDMTSSSFSTSGVNPWGAGGVVALPIFRQAVSLGCRRGVGGGRDIRSPRFCDTHIFYEVRRLRLNS